MDRQTDMMVLSDRDWREERWTGQTDRQRERQTDRQDGGTTETGREEEWTSRQT